MKRKITFLLSALFALMLLTQPVKVMGQTKSTITITYSDTFDPALPTASGSVNTNATAHTDKTQAANSFTFKEKSIYKGSSNNYLMFVKNAGYIYNTQSLGTINSVAVTYSSGTSTEGKAGVYFGSSEQSTYTTSSNATIKGQSQTDTWTNNTSELGFFQFSTSNKNVQVTQIVITYTSSGGGTPTPSLSVNPTTVAFGDDNTINPQNHYSRSFSVTFANITEALTVSVPTSLSNAGVSVSSTTIGTSETSPKTITVYFDPEDEVTLSGNITVSNTEDNLSQTVAVTGSAYDPASIVYYQQIAASQSDWTGKYIFTGYYTSDLKYQAFSSMNSNNYGNIQNVATSNNGIQSTTTIDGYALTVLYTRTVNNVKQYSIQMSDGKYLYYTGSSNALYAKAAFTAGDCEWTLTYSNGKVAIKNVGSTSRYLQYNSNSRFACYTNTQNDLYLFKYQGNVVLPLSLPFVTLEAGNGTITPTWAAVANADHYALQWSTSATFASDVHNVESTTSGAAISGLTNGTTYYIRVKAIGAGENPNTSDWSAIVSETPSAATIPTPEITLFEGISTGTANEYVDVASFKFTVEDQSEYILYYTLDGTDPTTSQTAVEYTYDNEVIINETTTIKVVATYLTDYSDIAELTVTIKPITPISTVFAATDSDNTYYYIEGIMTYKQSNSNRFVEDETAGILVYGSNSTIAVGDKLIIKGTKTTYNGKPEFQNITLVSTVSHDNTLPCHEISISQASDYMHRRVKYTQVLVGGTSGSVTSISQGNNTIGVYNMPSVTNVTDEGYYLKSITGVVGYYNTNSTNQMYVADGDIEAYEVTAETNDDNLGTVAISGYVITATPASGCSYNNPAFAITVNQGVTCEVTQNGNTFSVVTDGDAIVEIQFATNATPCTVTYHVNGTVTEFAGYQTKYQNQEIGNLPTTDAIGELSFMGWSLSDSDIALINSTYEIGSVSTLDLYAVYAIYEGIRTTYTLVGASNVTEGTYLIGALRSESATNSFYFADGTTSSGDMQTNDDATAILEVSNIRQITKLPTDAKEFVFTGNSSDGYSISISNNNATNYLGYTSTSTSRKLAFGDYSTTKWKAVAKTSPLVTNGVTLQTTEYKISENATSKTAIRGYTSNEYRAIYLFKKAETPVYSNYCTLVKAQETVLELDGDGKLTGNEVIPAGTAINLTSQVIIPNGKTLTVNGALGNDAPANLVIEDGGQLICSNSVAATVKKSIANANAKDPKNHWYTISSPVHTGSNNYVTIGNETTVNLTNNGAYDMFAYQESTHTWLNQKNNGEANGFDKMYTGQGYIYRNSGNELSYVGNTTVGPVNIALSYTSTLDVADLKGFNLIGNPYTHSIAKGAGKAIDNSKLSSGCYALTNSCTWTIIEDGAEIKPNQGVLVEVSETVADFQIKDINYVAPTPDPGKYKNDNIKFIVESSEYSDAAYAWFDKGIGLTKINHRNESAPMLYIPQDDNNYAIATMTDDTKAFNLNFKAATAGKYTLSYKATGAYNYLHVIDRLTGEDVDVLLEGEYSFIGTPKDSENRFIVRLEYMPNYGEDGNGIFAYQSGNDIVVSGEGELQVFDVMGRMVMTQRINGVETINIPTNGMYIFRLNEKVQKIVVE